MDADSDLPSSVRRFRLPATFWPNENAPSQITHLGHQCHAYVKDGNWIRSKNLGGGGHGIVWLESFSTDHRLRAVKEIRIRNKGSNKNKVDIVRELEALERFSRIEYIDSFVECHGWFESSESLFISMEYCEHGDLKNYLDTNGPMAEFEARDVTRQILKGLVFMHDSGFAHRDLKPANILIKAKWPQGRWLVKICDLGLTKRIEGDIATTTIKGTPGFMPPEVILPSRGQNPRKPNPFAGDIWCLGETVFHLLTDKPVFNNQFMEMIEYIRGESDFPRQVLKDEHVSEDAYEFLKALMKPAPDQRPSATEAQVSYWLQRFEAIEDPALFIENTAKDNRIASGIVASDLLGWKEVEPSLRLNPSTIERWTCQSPVSTVGEWNPPLESDDDPMEEELEEDLPPHMMGCGYAEYSHAHSSDESSTRVISSMSEQSDEDISGPSVAPITGPYPPGEQVYELFYPHSPTVSGVAMDPEDHMLPSQKTRNYQSRSSNFTSPPGSIKYMSQYEAQLQLARYKHHPGDTGTAAHSLLQINQSTQLPAHLRVDPAHDMPFQSRLVLPAAARDGEVGPCGLDGYSEWLHNDPTMGPIFGNRIALSEDGGGGHREQGFPSLPPINEAFLPFEEAFSGLTVDYYSPLKDLYPMGWLDRHAMDPTSGFISGPMYKTRSSPAAISPLKISTNEPMVSPVGLSQVKQAA